MLNNHTFPINLQESGIGYKIDVQDVYVKTVDGYSEKQITFV
jgi:hypothetical protein